MSGITTAAAVLAEASRLDQTMARPAPAIAAAWAKVFEGCAASREVLVEAVVTHYRKETRRIMPADVLRIATTGGGDLEVWFQDMARRGSVRLVERRADMIFTEPCCPLPDGTPLAECRAWMHNACQQWIVDHHDEIIVRVTDRESR